MKLKNSYVLLMAMAIFLLVSIGSACASEDVAADSDVQLASADDSVALTSDIEEVDDNVVSSGDTTQKTNTTITATTGDKQKFGYDEEKNITVTVKDNESNVINGLSKNNFNITEGKTSIAFSYTNANITILDKLAAGTHNLTISYLGNETYNPSKTNYLLKVYGNKTLEDVPTVVNADGTTVKIPARLTDGVENYTDLKHYTNITYDDDNQEIYDWTFDGTAITINSIKAVPANLTINYTANGASIIKKVQVKYQTTLTINPTMIEINEGQNATFIVTVTGPNGKLNITKENLTITKSVAINKFNASTGEVTLTGLKKGIYNLTLTFKGNAVNDTSKANVIINVHGASEINTNGTSVNVNSTKKGEIQIINITDGVDTFDFNKSNTKINVTYKDGNATKTIEVTNWDIVNGTIKFELENGNFTTANLTITYNETTTKNVTLNRIYNALIIAKTIENEYKDGNFTFQLVDVDDNNAPLAGKSISLYTTGNIRAGFAATTDKNGIASFKNANLYEFDQSSTTLAMHELKVGDHAVEIQASGNVNVTNNKDKKLKTNLTVTKANLNIKIDPFEEEFGTTKKVKITVTNAKSGAPATGVILHLYMPQTSGKDYYFQTNANGTSEIVVSGLVSGTYDVTVSNNDTTNMNKKEVKGTITILPKPVVINAKDVTIYYNTGTTSTIKITDKATGKAVAGAIILVQIDKDVNKTYLFQANSKGEVSFSASLPVGKHSMAVSTADTRYKGTTVTKTITVKKASAKITAKKVTTYYKGGKYFTIKLTNTKNGKPIYDAKLNVKIYVSKNKYYNYNGTTGANGQLKLLIDLKPGKYKVEVLGADAKDFTAKQVTSKIVVKKAPAKLTPKKLTAKKGAKKYFKVTVTNKKTKKAISGVKVKMKVYTGKKAKSYTAKTNAKGIAKILTNKLKAGKHKVVVTSANKYVKAKKAKSTIKIKK